MLFADFYLFFISIYLYILCYYVQLPYGTVGDNGRHDDHEVGKLDEAEDEAADVELPPPMKPINVSNII